MHKGSAQGDYVLDLVIPNHDPDRNIERIIQSARDSFDSDRGGGDLRVIVVAHNLDENEQERFHHRLLAIAPCELIQVLDFAEANTGRQTPSSPIVMATLNDGIQSPAGPWNAGINLVESPWFALAGSDDDLEPGALNFWLDAARSSGADAAIGKLIRPGGLPSNTPPVRIGQPEMLDAVKDRLYYRASPVAGVYRTQFVQDVGALMSPECGTGEDIAFLERVWSLGRIVNALQGPGYLELAQATSRATTTKRPLTEDLAGIQAALAPQVLEDLTPKQQSALGTKLLRRDVPELVGKHLETEFLNPEDVSVTAELIRQIESTCPGARKAVSMNDAAVLDLFVQAPPQRALKSAALRTALKKRSSLRSLGSLVSAQPLLSFTSQAPLRYRAAGKRLNSLYRT